MNHKQNEILEEVAEELRKLATAQSDRNNENPNWKGQSKPHRDPCWKLAVKLERALQATL
jgi:hypothetical protein